MPPSGPAAHADDFRAAAARFASGVTVVTTRSGELVFGKTVSSFASLSLDPVLITVSVAAGGHLARLVRESGSFGVSVLARGQEAVSRYFAVEIHEPVREEFPGMTTVPEVTGAPIVAGCLSFFDCQLHDILPGGDHVILIGRVVATGGGEGDPLVYWRGGYRALHPAHDSTGGDEQRVLEQVGEVFAVQLQLLDFPSTELVDAQAAIEPTMAELAAQRAGPEEREQLLDCATRGEREVGDRFSYHRSSVDFHNLLAHACGNRLLQLALRAVRRVQEAHYLDATEAEAARFAAEHRLIGEAVARGDVLAARSEMARHVESIRDMIKRVTVGPAGPG
ncbi:MAG: flavin reductase [Frankiaceae bacterium]